MEGEEYSNKLSLPESDDKNKILSSQVLEYYKKYSQNRELPKYFSGASTSSFRIEDWYEQVKQSPISNVQTSATVAVNTEETSEETIKPVLSQSTSPMAEQDQLCESSKISDINICVTSPTSSVASNRKLEWDNGADIGYSNVETSNKNKTLKKSVSLPIINTLEYKGTHKVMIEDLQSKKTDIENINPTVIPFKVAYSSTNTSESVKSPKDSYTSSSSTDDHQQYLSSDSELISDMQKFTRSKLQGPIAESTPIVKPNGNGDTLNTSKNGSLKKWHSQLDLNMVDRISFYKNMKILKLSVAKPIVIECRGAYEPLPGRDKLIQTSLPRNPSIAVQTDFDLTEGVRKDAKPMERQSILYVCHSDSDKETNRHSSAAIQTDSDVLSNCNSFEYLSGNDYDKNFQTQDVKASDEIEVIPSTSTSRENEIVVLEGNLRKCPPRSDLSTKTTPSSDISSKESTSTDPNFSKQSEDLEKKLQLLKKVIKSKKYDSVTKKNCLKKIIQTMLDSKFSDESSESVSGSKKSEVGEIIREKKSSTSDTSEENKLNLHDNKPWLPVQLEDLHFKENQMSSLQKLQTQTFTNEILPEIRNHSSEETNSSKSKKTRLQRNQLFTLTSGNTNIAKDKLEVIENDKYDHGDSSNSATNDLYDTIEPTISGSATPLISSANSLNSKDNSNGNRSIKELQSWRQNKTRSEELLEQQTVENKDRLVNFAKKEREQQLYWIKNEISHLHKLKNLLENDQKSNNNEPQIQHDVLQKFLQKPHVEDMKGLKKSTTLYIVTTEKSAGTSKSSTMHSGCTKSTCKNPCCRGRYISPTRNSRSPSGSPSRHITFQTGEPCKCKHSSGTCQHQPSTELSLRPLPSTSAPCTCRSQSAPPSVCSDKNIVSVDNGKIDLQNAHLLSNEQFTTCTNNIKCRTSIRRYTFEIPMENQTCCADKNSPKPCIENKQPDPASTPKSCADACSKEEIINTCLTVDFPSCLPPNNCGIKEVKDIKKPKQTCIITDTKQTNTKRDTKESCTITTCPCKDDKITQTYFCKKDRATSSCTEATSSSCKPKAAVSCASSESSSSSSESDLTPGSSTTQLCHCCKKRYSNFRRSSLQNDNNTYILCYPCYSHNEGKHYYTYPGHVCTCYNKQMETIQQIQDTIHQLEVLEREEEYCKCSYRKSHSSSGYCLKCGHRLRNYFRTKKGGLSYVVTLESDENLNKKCRKKKEPVLEEIKIKIPSPRSKSKKVYSDCSKSGEESCKENASIKITRKHHKKHKHKKCHKPTLQEYLCANKPGFIASAEQRRQCLLDLAYMREQRCQKYKQLLALTNGIPFKNNINRNKASEKCHVFTTKEMKQMTAKHYKKLPEVQQKLEQNKDRQIRKANKLLADIFNQRLRQQVLKGKHTIPPDASIINLA